MVWDNAFEVAFHPKTIAIVGVSNNPRGNHVGFNGLTTFCNIREQGFEGRIYPINPKVNEVHGVRAYPSVSAVPELVDLVIVAVPADIVPQVLEDCIVAGALNIHVMTSGFGETGQEEGRRLDEAIHQIARRGKLNIIGPNCMGLQVPNAKMSTFDIRPLNSGPVAFVSQSGAHVSTLLRYAAAFGIGVSKAISLGNALVMDSTDFLEYLGTDPETKIIALYLEGVRDGRKLMQLTREVNRVKPVIIWKGGLTDAGAQAASSHTGSLKGNRQVWEAFFRQTGAIQVRSIEELADVIMTLLYLKPLHGKAAALLLGGGGNSVAAGDICGEEGIQTPPLTQGSKAKLLQFVSLVNQGLANPLDIPWIIRNPNLFRQALEIVVSDPVIDFVMLNYNLEFMRDADGNSLLIECLCRFVRENPHSKPLVVALSGQTLVSELPSAVGPLAERLIQAGIPVYASLTRACRAILRFIKYHQQTLHYS